MKRIYITLLIVSLSGALFAVGPKGEGPMRPEGGPMKDKGIMMKMVKELDLSKDQLGKIEALRKEQENETGPVVKELQGLHKDLRKELAKAPINDGAVNDIVNKLTEDQRKMLFLHVKYTKETQKILTPEQQNKLSERLDKMETTMMERHAGEELFGPHRMGPQERLRR